MPDRPSDNPDAPVGDPARTLNDILAALSQVGEDATEPPTPGGSPMQGAVTELSAALDQLFAMVRSDRAEQRARIAELEAALSAAHARIRQLEAGEQLDIPAPPPNDFGQLREAAERLRRRTEELFRDAGPPTAGDPESDLVTPTAHEPAPAGSEGPAGDEDPREAALLADAEDAAEARIKAARDAVETSIADEHPAAHTEPIEFAKPGVLHIVPGTADHDPVAIDVECDLAFDDEGEDEAVAAAVVLPVPTPDERDGERAQQGEPSEPVHQAEPGEPAAEQSAEPEPESGAAESRPATVEQRAPEQRHEPVEIAPRPARKRRAGLRRRRIDARKLASVDPATALRAMVSAIDDIWTAGVTLDLVIALTDGGSLKVAGGHTKPLSVVAVKPGTPARTTVTATTAQLIPLFGRLELTDEQSAPLIHGPRRDADLLVGWIDRAQRLEPQPL